MIDLLKHFFGGGANCSKEDQWVYTRPEPITVPENQSLGDQTISEPENWSIILVYSNGDEENIVSNLSQYTAQEYYDKIVTAMKDDGAVVELDFSNGKKTLKTSYIISIFCGYYN